jgi:hypothetical protein
MREKKTFTAILGREYRTNVFVSSIKGLVKKIDMNSKPKDLNVN